jgi:hypothetical protein
MGSEMHHAVRAAATVHFASLKNPTAWRLVWNFRDRFKGGLTADGYAWTERAVGTHMHNEVEQTLRQVDARLAELKATPQGRKLAAWDESLGRLISYAQAAAWVCAAGIASAMTVLVMAVVEGSYAIAAAGIGLGLAALLLWRAWNAFRRTRTVSEMIADEATAQLGPAKMVLGMASRLRGAAGKAQ